MADTIVKNGNLITLDEAYPGANSLVIRKGRIAYTGSVEGTARYRSPGTGEINLQGKTLIFGFNDNHLHAVSTGDCFSRPVLIGIDGPQIIVTLLAAEKNMRPGETIYGFGWDHPCCPNPHRHLLDRHFPKR
jgi:hypothetical protein